MKTIKLSKLELEPVLSRFKSETKNTQNTGYDDLEFQEQEYALLLDL